MTQRNDKDTTGRTVAIVGGGALLLWLLLRRIGSGSGGGDGSSDGSGQDGNGTTAPTAATSPCQIRIDADGIELDGVPTDLAAMTSRCQATGSAEVRATGAAITGVIAEVVQALRAAGVQVFAAPDVWSSVDVTRRSR